MKRIASLLVSAALLLLGACGAFASTFSTQLVFVAGAGHTGQATSVLVTVYDNQRNVLVSASNAPGGTAVAESSNIAGDFYTPYTVDTTKLPLTVEFSVPANSGTSTPASYAATVSGFDRAAEIADGYTSGRAAALDTTGTNAATAATQATSANTRVTLGVPAVNPGASGGLPTVNSSNQVSIPAVTLGTGDETNLTSAASQATSAANLGASSATAIGNVAATVNALPTASANATAVWSTAARTITGGTASASNLPADYLTSAEQGRLAAIGSPQQASVPITLPSTAPAGYGGASVQSIIQQIQALLPANFGTLVIDSGGHVAVAPPVLH